MCCRRGIKVNSLISCRIVKAVRLKHDDQGDSAACWRWRRRSLHPPADQWETSFLRRVGLFLPPLQSSRFLKPVSPYWRFYHPPCLIAAESGPASPRAWSRTESRCWIAPYSNYLDGCALASPARGKVEGFLREWCFISQLSCNLRKHPTGAQEVGAKWASNWSKSRLMKTFKRLF